MMAPPIYRCYEHIMGQKSNEDIATHVVFMSPSGTLFNQRKAEELSKYEHVVILCGHYEGVDRRIIDEIVDEEISIGDYVLTGGEIPACILVDCVSRLVDGVLSDPECHTNEIISSGLLEYPQYTRPYEFHGMTVPDVLISGHHENIEKWRYEQSLAITKERRPDLLVGKENSSLET
jgi:tRNA (guanine37-N1)-methyltransferase